MGNLPRKLEDRAVLWREELGGEFPTEMQGVTKARIASVLGQLALGANADLIDCVFAMLDTRPSWFSKPPEGATFADGATTAHLACHIGILQRGKTKLDREGRDYWIKPLRDLGGFEAVTLYKGEYIPGHNVAKSPNSSYRLDQAFIDILKAPEADWPAMLEEWANADAARERMAFQATMEKESLKRTDSGHKDLIKASVDHYVPRFLPGFHVLYIDDADGDRISDEEKAKMAEAGVQLTLEDAMPDVFLWNPDTDMLWVIEAVTSDGEVDMHKVNQMKKLSDRCGKAGVGFTTTYQTWKAAAVRQGRNKNLAVDSYVWIQEDGSKQLYVAG
ncbi:BsuBI/PstI family type II restriction endonuclease [Ruegeria sp. HKCCE4148]|uniref:BsuBI/PstI family type II restriction endonuclease n=1 Tax=Ruegeria sp. HKCCE4148 TaxID=2794829 RepID=UPI001AE3949D|nr:BsuBI/PstI family type II restriction endonuclease [Ruegeria sp. HKCCE4148]